MATISTRVDENIKIQAEDIADQIGIPLSTAINIFIRQFIKSKGFPFAVKVQETEAADNANKSLIDLEVLDAAIKAAVADPNTASRPENSVYLDPKTNKLLKF